MSDSCGVYTDMAGNSNIIQEKVNIHVGHFWLLIIIVSFLVLSTATALVVIHSVRKKRRFDSD